MSSFLRAIKNNLPEKEKSKLTESDLKKWGLEGVCVFLRASYDMFKANIVKYLYAIKKKKFSLKMFNKSCLI